MRSRSQIIKKVNDNSKPYIAKSFDQPISHEEPPLSKDEIQEMMLIASVEFAKEQSKLFGDFLEKNHPFLFQIYMQGNGDRC